MPKATGTVYRSGSKERIAGASIRAQRRKEVVLAATDDDGDFTLSGLKAGKWSLTAFHDTSFPSKPQDLNISGDRAGLKFYLSRLAGTVDQEKGRTFFTGLLITLGVLIGAWLLLHWVIPGGSKPISSVLIDSIAEAEEHMADLAESSALDELLPIIEDINEQVDVAIDATTDLNEADKQILTGLATEFQEAASGNDIEVLEAKLAELRDIVENRPAPSFSFWNESPLRFLEVLLWGLAGALVNKIILTGWYLRKNSFYSEGIVMHVSHLVTTPLLVLVAVLLLSLVTLQITLAGGSEVSLDLNDPQVVVAVAFVLGSSPWPLWNFIEKTQRRVMGEKDDDK